MPGQRNPEYYYGDESEQFSYFRIPRLLMTSPRFKALSTDAKLLYGLLLDRMGLSAKNGWYDDQNRVYIYYTLDEIQEDMGCGHNKAVHLLAELDSNFGLIERRKQGQGRPTMIFVKRFTDEHCVSQSEGSLDFPKEEVLASENQTSELPKRGSLDFPKSAVIYNDLNKTDAIQPYQSIDPAPERMDRYECRRVVEELIDYEMVSREFGKSDAECAVELIVDTLCTTKATVRIGGEDVPTGQVRGRLMQLEYAHVEYVFDSLKRCSTDIRNMRAYLLTSFYNAPVTIDKHYEAMIRHNSR